MFFDDKVGVTKNIERAKGCVFSPSVVAFTLLRVEQLLN